MTITIIVTMRLPHHHLYATGWTNHKFPEVGKAGQQGDQQQLGTRAGEVHLVVVLVVPEMAVMIITCHLNKW